MRFTELDDDDDGSPTCMSRVCAFTVQMLKSLVGYALLVAAVYAFGFFGDLLITHAQHPAIAEILHFIEWFAITLGWSFSLVLIVILFLLALNHVRVHREEISAAGQNLCSEWYRSLLFGGCGRKKRKKIEAEYENWWDGREPLYYDPGEFLVASLTRWRGTMLEQVLGDPIGKPTFYALMGVHAILFYVDSVYHLDPLSSDVVIGLPTALMIFLVVFYGGNCCAPQHPDPHSPVVPSSAA